MTRQCPHEMEHCACTYSPGRVLNAPSPRLDGMHAHLRLMTSQQVTAQVVPAPSTSANERFSRWRSGNNAPLPRSEYPHHAVVTGEATEPIHDEPANEPAPVEPQAVEPQPAPPTNWDEVWYEVWRDEPFLGQQYVDLVKGQAKALQFAQSRPTGNHVIRPLRIAL